jgi:hypothetical protein
MVGRLEGKRPLGRPCHRWKDAVKINLKELIWQGAEWIRLAQDRDECQALVNMVLNLQVP